MDAVALHQAHRAGVEYGQTAVAIVFCFGLRGTARRSRPGRRPRRSAGTHRAGALVADAPQRLGQPVRMMLALGIARDFWRRSRRRCKDSRRRPARGAIRRQRSTSSAQVEGQSCGRRNRQNRAAKFRLGEPLAKLPGELHNSPVYPFSRSAGNVTQQSTVDVGTPEPGPAKLAFGNQPGRAVLYMLAQALPAALHGRPGQMAGDGMAATMHTVGKIAFLRTPWASA